MKLDGRGAGQVSKLPERKVRRELIPRGGAGNLSSPAKPRPRRAHNWCWFQWLQRDARSYAASECLTGALRRLIRPEPPARTTPWKQCRDVPGGSGGRL